jgi:hypothetical protein
MSVVVIALFNGLLSLICGLWFKVLALIPLFVIALIEVAFLKQSGIGLSPFWLAVGLIVVLEVGYLIGASIGALGLKAAGGTPRAFIRPGYREMSVIAGE